MTGISLNSIESHIAERLQQRASRNGRTVEAEVEAIIVSVLNQEREPKKETTSNDVDLATAIKQRLSPLEGFDMPELTREAIRMPPSFEQTDDSLRYQRAFRTDEG